SAACHRRAWAVESTVQHTPSRHLSGRSGTSDDHDCISAGSQASTSVTPPRIRSPPLNPNRFTRFKNFRNGHSGLIGVPAAYALARRNFPGKRFVIVLFLVPMMIPPITFGIPLATVLYQLHLGGSMSGVILANLVPTVPFVVLVMIPFIE